MKPIIGRTTPRNWGAHLALILAAAAAAALLASHVEGEPLRKVTMGVLIVLVLMLIIQNLVERVHGGRVNYRIPYAVCAAASILMLVGQSMDLDFLVTTVAEVSGFFFAIGIIVFAFQVRRLLRSP